MRLPANGPGAGAAAAEPSTWLVGARRGAAADRIARAHGAVALRVGHIYRLPRSRARAFAADLRRAGVLHSAEPNVALERASAFDQLPQGWARSAVVDPGLAPPAPTPAATVAVVDELVDVTHPDLTHVRQLNPGPIIGDHGTAVASVIGGAANGVGVFGIYPSVPIISVGMPLNISCADATNAIVAAAETRARVINLSFGGPGDCSALYAAVQIAYAAGSLVVASAGNDFEAGNPVIYPAAYPHVLSVAALTLDLQSAGFSSENVAVDISAPGVAIPIAVPPAFDRDGSPDGLTLASGTSFSAPIVSGAAAWLAAARPQLDNGQLADVLRRSARDVGPAGYDTGTGLGIVRMSGALIYPTPRRDLLEPNDGITFVNGTVFTQPDPFIWRGIGRRSISGHADQIEDPLDVYRIRLQPRSRARVRLRPNFGDPDLTIFRGNAQSVTQTSRIVGRSDRGARRVDSVTLRNSAPGARTFYVVIDVSSLAGGGQDASYRLELSRLRRR